MNLRKYRYPLLVLWLITSLLGTAGPVVLAQALSLDDGGMPAAAMMPDDCDGCGDGVMDCSGFCLGGFCTVFLPSVITGNEPLSVESRRLPALGCVYESCEPSRTDRPPIT